MTDFFNGLPKSEKVMIDILRRLDKTGLTRTQKEIIAGMIHDYALTYKKETTE